MKKKLPILVTILAVLLMFGCSMDGILDLEDGADGSAGSRATTYSIVIDKLVCIETEDLTGADTARFRVWSDNVQKFSQMKSMNNGSTWDFYDMNISFSSTLKIKLEDRDKMWWGTDYDNLGEMNLKVAALPILNRDIEFDFTGDGAFYKLYYRIVAN